MRRNCITRAITSFALASALALTSVPVVSAAENMTGGASHSESLISSEASVSNNGISLSVSADWSIAEGGALGIKAGFDLGDVVKAAAGQDVATVEVVLAEGLFAEKGALSDTVQSWNEENEAAGVKLAAATEWVCVTEMGERSATAAGEPGALQLVKLFIEVKAGEGAVTPFELPVSLSDSSASSVRARMDIPTAQQPVFFDASTSVIEEDGTVGIDAVPGITVSANGATAAVKSPILLCEDAVDAQGRAAMSAAVPAAQDSPWHIAGFTLDRVYSGTAIWNGNSDEAGHDSGASNDIIRSYDSVIYSTSYALAVKDGLGSARSGKLHVEATLPLSKDLMTWDLDSMVWLKNVKVTEVDGKQKVAGDVVFGGDSSVPVAPSVGMLNFVAKVRNVSQGQQIDAPSFAVQKYADDGVSLEGAKIKCGSADRGNTTAENADLKGSARGRYNAQLKAEGGNRYTITLQMRSESGGLKGMALPDEEEFIEIDLRSDWGQNLRGVKVNAIGSEDVFEQYSNVFALDDYGTTAPFAKQADGSCKTSFNTIFNSGEVVVKEYVDDTGAGTHATFKLQVLQFEIDRENIDKIAATHNAARTSDNEEPDYDREEIYNFGSYLFELHAPQYGYDKNTTYVNITSLKVTDSGGETTGDCYEADNECSQIHKPGGSVKGDTGFYINYNTEIKGGKSTERVSDDGELIEMPDILGGSYVGVYEVAPGESFVTASNNQYFLIDDDVDSYFSRKDAPRYVTKFLKFDDEVFEVDASRIDKIPPRAHVFSQDSGWQSHGYADVITKYVTKTGGWGSDDELLTSHLENDHATHFEDKPTGSLKVHSSYESAQKSGEPIVGVVFDILVDDNLINAHFEYQDVGTRQGTSLYVQIRTMPLRIREDAAVRGGKAITAKDDPRLVGMMTWDSVTSCVDMYRTETNSITGKTEYVNTHAYLRRSDLTTTPGKWQWINRGNAEKFSENIFTGYKKAVYNSNGNIEKRPESAARLNGAGDYDNCPAAGGASFYVRLNGVDVSKKVAQQSNGAPKVNFDLDEGQRRVDFAIDALHTGSELSKFTDAVTITDTIPAGMNPVDPEAKTVEGRWGIFYGGVYKQDKTTNGGAGGEWVDDDGNVVSADPADTQAWKAIQSAMDKWLGDKPTLSYRVEETKNNDGSTTLTWTFENVPVSHRLPKIHYSVKLGSSEDAFQDLANGDSLVNTVNAKLTTSGAEDTDSATVAVVRAQSASVIKEAKVERRNADGTDPMGFDITFVNNANQDTAPLKGMSVVDVLPGADDGSWSTLAEGITELGGYKLDNVSLDAVGFPKGNMLHVAYVVAGSEGQTRENLRAQLQDGSLYDDMTNLSGPQNGWQRFLVEFDEGGALTSESKAMVEGELGGKEIIAIGVYAPIAMEIPPGAMFKLGYEYKWDDDAENILHNTSDTFTNTVTLRAAALNKSVISTATTVPTPRDMDFEFTKVDSDGAALAGAEFQLYRWLGSGDAPTTGLIDPSNVDNRNWQFVDTVQSGADGKVAFTGLGSLDGSPWYRLVETKAPDGFLLPGGQWNIRVDVINEQVSPSEVAGDGGVKPPAFDNSGGQLKLPNHRAIDIPSSGGRGTTAFVAAGAALAGAGAYAALQARRKAQASTRGRA